jgi:Protein of unknown function (DUF1501)
MDYNSVYPCGRVSRRGFLTQAAGGFFGAALSGLLAEDEKLPGARLGPHFEPRAKSVIYLFMCGGVSQLDTFDPKDNKHAGKLMDGTAFGDNVAEIKRPVIPCIRTFTRCGQSGVPVSDILPNVGSVIDEIAVVRSMWNHEGNHFPAVIETATSHRGRAFDHPCLGSWVSYALGSANKNLPTYVNIGRPSSPVQLTGGYLGAGAAATPFQAGETPIPNLYPPKRDDAAERELQMQTLVRLNREFRDAYAVNSDIRGRVQSYELAARMQLSAPEVVDFSSEPKNVLDLYGIGEKETDEFGRQLLMARRLAEKGVRYIQLCNGGGGNGSWDAHVDMKQHEKSCRAVDKPIAGLIRDLKQRGMLESTLVVFSSDFGRTPWSQNTTGRDHNPRGYSVWLAGGGVKGGMTHGETDEVGYRAVENPHYCSDLHATILHQLGLDYKKMEIPVFGRTFHLVEEGDGPIQAILA